MMNKDQAERLLKLLNESGDTFNKDLVPWLAEPNELIGLHCALLERAEDEATAQVFAAGTYAAGRVHLLWAAWRGREHGGDEVRVAANQAFAAVVQALRPLHRVVVERWFGVADGWIDQVRMIVDKK